MSLTTSAHWAYNPSAGFYGYEIDNSLRFNDDDSAYLSRTPASAGNRQIWTFSTWVKRGNLGGNQVLFGTQTGGSNIGYIAFDSNDKLDINLKKDDLTGVEGNSTRVFRDTSAWYHIVIVATLNEASQSDRVSIYVNNEIDVFVPRGSKSAGDGYLNGAVAHGIGYRAQLNDFFLDGYMAEVNFIDGTALDASYFGETKSGIWIPKEYSGSYGTNGFHLEFAGNASDTSGNGNNFTSFNISSYDYVPDSPTNNFPTNRKGYNQTASQGNLRFERSFNGNNHTGNFPSMCAKSGKWYAELRMIDSAIDTAGFAVVEGRSFNEPSDVTGYQYTVDNNTVIDGKGYYSWIINAKKTDGFAQTETSYGTALTANTAAIIMCALDLDNGKVWWGKDGTWFNSGDPAAGTNAAFTSSNLTDSEDGFGFASNLYAGRGGAYHIFNYGQDSTFVGTETAGGNADANGYGDFKYAPPSGFLAMCSANLPAPTFDPLDDVTSEDYFNTVLYTGNGSSQSITGVGFKPDLVWIKDRSNGGNDHKLYDFVRGQGKELEPSSSDTEYNWGSAPHSGLYSFDSDGFSVGSNPSHNTNTNSYVAWTWLGDNTTGTSNTDGSITSTVNVNQDAGFSIATYTGNATAGATVGHGLGVAPDVVLIKARARSGGSDWPMYHKSIPNSQNGWIRLNLTNAWSSTSILWNNTAPSSSVVTLGSYDYVNDSGTSHVMYSFAEKEGYSKFGKYTGNSSSDGTFIYTGFRPAFILAKEYTTNSTYPWMLLDSARDPYNQASKELSANSTHAEDPTYPIDFLSNGFKWRYGGVNGNGNGLSYIYMAFAEQPFKYANAR